MIHYLCLFEWTFKIDFKMCITDLALYFHNIFTCILLVLAPAETKCGKFTVAIIKPNVPILNTFNFSIWNMFQVQFVKMLKDFFSFDILIFILFGLSGKRNDLVDIESVIWRFFLFSGNKNLRWLNGPYFIIILQKTWIWIRKKTWI